MTHIGKIVTPSRRLKEGAPYVCSWLMPIPDKSLRLIPRLGGHHGLLKPELAPGTKSLADADVSDGKGD
jgi:hypothetical protein